MPESWKDAEEKEERRRRRNNAGIIVCVIVMAGHIMTTDTAMGCARGRRGLGRDPHSKSKRESVQNTCKNG